MNILLTAISLVALLGCILAFTRCQKLFDDVAGQVNLVERHTAKLAAERSRVTVLERESDALRRWIKRVEGKLHANEREEQALRGVPPSADGGGINAPFCENYEVAQKEGPHSKAAQCMCNYCLGRRAAKAAFRDAAVPKTAQAQGELARLNGSKP